VLHAGAADFYSSWERSAGLDRITKLRLTGWQNATGMLWHGTVDASVRNAKSKAAIAQVRLTDLTTACLV